MRSLDVLAPNPGADYTLGLEAVLDVFEVSGLLFEGSQQPLNDDVVHTSAPTVHGDTQSGLSYRGDPGRSGELAALVGVHDIGRAGPGNGLVQSLDAEACACCYPGGSRHGQASRACRRNSAGF